MSNPLSLLASCVRFSPYCWVPSPQDHLLKAKLFMVPSTFFSSTAGVRGIICNSEGTIIATYTVGIAAEQPQEAKLKITSERSADF